MTVRELFELWIAGVIGGYVRPSVTISRRSIMRRALLVCGDVTVHALDINHLWQLQRRSIQDGMSHATTNAELWTLRAMLRDAAMAKLVAPGFPRTLFEDLRALPKIPNPNRTPFTREQRDAILDTIRTGSKAWGLPFVAFLFSTGLRTGEALALTFADVDTTRRWLRVIRTRDGRYVGPPKTAGSVREIPLSLAAVTALATIPRGKVADYVFCGPLGAPITPTNFERSIWRPTMARLGLVGRPMYCTRHSYISYQLEAGWTPAEVAAYCGTSVAKILSTYGRYTARFRELDLDSGLATPAPRAVTRLGGRQP